MPRNKLNGYSYVTLHGCNEIWSYVEEENIVVCTICLQRFEYGTDITFRIKKHESSDKHQNNVVPNAKRQQKQEFTKTDKSNQVFTDLLHAFVSPNTPLERLKNIEMKSFLETYTGKSIPDESTLRKSYLSKSFKKTMTEITSKLIGKNSTSKLTSAPTLVDVSLWQF